MGHFGGKHTADHDAPLGYTHLLSCSDLCADEDPGFFVILMLGVCLQQIHILLVPLELPHRDVELPQLFCVDNHTKAPKYGANKGKIYIAEMDTSPKGLRALKEYLTNASIPEGKDNGAENAGTLLHI